MHKNTRLWIIYALVSAVTVALLLCFAQAAYGINQQMTEKEVNKQIEEENNKDYDNSFSKITGMAGSEGMGTIMAIIGAIMAVVIILVMLGTLFKGKAAACLVVNSTPPCLGCLTPLCMALLAVAILLIIFGIQMMNKADEVSSGERTTDNSPGDGGLAGNVEQQASANQA